VRVIAGKYRSRPLTAPKNLTTRPTSDKLRETLFNVLAARVDGPRIEGCTFADLYAGSGANGIEAISRGARHIYFVENGPPALAAVRANLRSLGIDGGYSVEPRSVAAFLRRMAATAAAAPETALDIVFLDPPYEDREAYATTLGLLGGDCAAALAPDAVVVAEHRYKQPLAERYGSLERYRVLKQGDAALSFYSFPKAGSSA
jgi:16S rRNA (guanine966-N2)-methyltransferase